MPRRLGMFANASWMSALPHEVRDSSVDAAPQQSQKALHSHPMERSTAIRTPEWMNDDYSSPECFESSYRIDSPIHCQYRTPTPHLGHRDPKDLHNPRRNTDPVLLRIAEMLCESLPSRFHFTPSYLFNMEDEDTPREKRRESDEWTNEELSILTVHQILQQAALPIDTYLIAVLILQKLDSRFYREWRHPFSHELEEDDDYEWVGLERPRELAIAAALILAQKFIHDSVYLIETWCEVVLWDRPNVSLSDIKVTERIMLSKQYGINWSLNEIATEEAVAELVFQVEEEACDALERLEPFLTDVKQYSTYASARYQCENESNFDKSDYEDDQDFVDVCHGDGQPFNYCRDDRESVHHYYSNRQSIPCGPEDD